MAVNDKYNVVLVQVLDGVSLANVFKVNVLDDSGTSDTPASIATEFESKFVDAMNSNQGNGVANECLLIGKLQPMSAPSVVYPLSGIGLLSPDELPSNVALCVNTVCNDGRPPFRGRWFIGGLMESDVNNGRWKQGIEADWAPFIDAVPLAFGPANESFQLNHYSPAQDQFDPFTRARITPIPRKLRNRTPGQCSIS